MKDKLQQALDLCNNSEFDKAIPLLEEITEEDPQNSEAWRVLAQIHWNHQHLPDRAYDELIESLKCDPKNIWALILMGNLLSKEKKDVEHAKVYYDKVLEYYPDNVIAINNIGATYLELNNFEQALPFLKQALTLNDSYVNSYYGLAYCYYKLGRLEDSFQTCRQGAVKSADRPENPSVREELMKLYMTVARELSNQTNYINVWRGIKDELEAVDNIQIRFVEDRKLEVLAKLEYAPLHGAKEHVLRYHPDKEYVDHIFVHEMMHLKMNQRATAARRAKAVVCTESTRKSFFRRYQKYIQKAHRLIPQNEQREVMVQMANSLGLQLMNCPLDLFVEHMMFEDYKVMRPIQMLSLFHQELTNIDAVKKVSGIRFLPSEVVRANKVMNIVTSMHFKELFGINLVKEYRPTKAEYEQAADLFDEFKAYLSSYKAGDEYEMIEYFVDSFNMGNLVEIIDESEAAKMVNTSNGNDTEINTMADKMPPEEEIDAQNAKFALDHQDGADPTETMMMSMYMLGAMEYFDTITPQEVRHIALEIATVGMTGISPQKRYSINSIPNKEFSGYQFLAYYYVSWARAIPEMVDKLELPFTKAYEQALQLYNAKTGTHD